MSRFTIFVFEIKGGIVDTIHQYPYTPEGKIEAEKKFEEIYIKYYPIERNIIDKYLKDGYLLTEDYDGVQIKYQLS